MMLFITTIAMARYRISAEGFDTSEVDCTGCSGDALQLALATHPIRHWKVNRRSPDGRKWFFDVVLAASNNEQPLEFQVETLG